MPRIVEIAIISVVKILKNLIRKAGVTESRQYFETRIVMMISQTNDIWIMEEKKSQLTIFCSFG